MTYNLTNIGTNSSTGLLGFVQGVNNELMLGYLGVLLLMGLVMVFFISYFYSTRDVGKSISGTAFVSFGLAIFLRALDLIPDIALFITLIGSAVAIAFLWNSQ